MAHATSDYVYNAAVHFLSEREQYDRYLKEYGKDDPQTVAALMRVRSAEYRMRVAVTGVDINRAAND